jgi:predicted O-methyltransferase YrrM
MTTRALPSAFDRDVAEILRIAAPIEGHLIDKEIKLLALLAALPTTLGDILEIGSFKGKSTVVLAKAALLAKQSRIVAVDPLTSPSITDPSLKGQASGWDDFQSNLNSAGVFENVEFHRQLSSDLARTWKAGRKIRLLWIDGDHTYQGAKLDFDLFSAFLDEGAIVAMHDVLRPVGGPLRVFREDILQSPRFGAAGFCGSIGWAQFLGSLPASSAALERKQHLLLRLEALLPYIAAGMKLKGLSKLGYKLARARVPHGEVSPAVFLRQVQFKS